MDMNEYRYEEIERQRDTDEKRTADVAVMLDEHTPHHAHYLTDEEATIVCQHGPDCCEWPMVKNENTGNVWTGADFFAYALQLDQRARLWDEVRLIQCLAIIRAAQIRKRQPTDPKRFEVWHYTRDGEPMHRAEDGNPFICKEICRQTVRHTYDELTGTIVEKTYPVSFTHN